MTDATRRFGDIEVTILLDGLFEASTDLLVHRDGDAARDAAAASWGARPMPLDVNAFLLRGPDGITLIDTGCGTAWGPEFGKARAVLAGAGVTPPDVDRVILTHIHSDHALGLLDGDAAYFPRAEILAPETDLAYFTDTDAKASLPEARRGAFDIAAQLVAAYGPRFRGFPLGEVRPGIETMPLPGHTPGQVGFRLRGARGDLLIWGDALHVAGLQAPDPKLGLTFDLDPATAAETRRAVLEEAAAEGWLVAGGHIHGFGRVRREGAGFRIDPA